MQDQLNKGSLANQLEELDEVAQFMIDNKLLPRSYKSKQHAIKALAMGRSIGLDDMSSINLIDIIQDKPAISSRGIAGLMTRAGIGIEVIKDYEAITETKPAYILDEKGAPTFDEKGFVKCYKDHNGDPIMKTTELDRTTQVKFIRHFNKIGNVECVVEMRLSDAKLASWYPDKSTWQTLPRFMMMARCISRGSRIIAADVTGGMYSIEEMLEVSGVDAIITEDGDVLVES